MNFEKLLEGQYSIKEVSSLPGCLFYDFTTPAHRFGNYVLRYRGQALLVPTRDQSFNQRPVKLLRDLTKTELIDFDFPFQVFDNIEISGTSFECAARISPEYHDMLKHLSLKLHEQTHVVFPMFRCEFSGDESPEIVRLMRKDLVPTLDWSRTPAPKIMMSYANTLTKARSKGMGLGLAGYSTLIREINNLRLPDSDGSYVTARNYLGLQCKIAFSFQRVCFLVTGMAGDDLIEVPPDDIHVWIDDFLGMPR